PFPTRRSSDLPPRRAERVAGGTVAADAYQGDGLRRGREGREVRRDGFAQDLPAGRVVYVHPGLRRFESPGLGKRSRRGRRPKRGTQRPHGAHLESVRRGAGWPWHGPVTFPRVDVARTVYVPKTAVYSETGVSRPASAGRSGRKAARARGTLLLPLAARLAGKHRVEAPRAVGGEQGGSSPWRRSPVPSAPAWMFPAARRAGERPSLPSSWRRRPRRWARPAASWPPPPASSFPA